MFTTVVVLQADYWPFSAGFKASFALLDHSRLIFLLTMWPTFLIETDLDCRQAGQEYTRWFYKTTLLQHMQNEAWFFWYLHFYIELI